jgi:exodeoxyribonuclease V gamma subunit
MEALRQGGIEEKLPKRLCVFGISTLPPSYLDLLLALGRHVPVHIFVLSPCSQYWGDLAGKREQIRDYRQLTKSGLRVEIRPEDATPLAGLGRLGRDFHELLTTAGVDALPLYRPNPNPITLLEHLQEDLLNLERTLEQDKQPCSTRPSSCIAATAPCAKWKCCTMSSLIFWSATRPLNHATS